MINDIFAVDWDQVRFRRAFSGLLAILMSTAFISIVGTVVLVVVIATLFNIAAANDGPMAQRWKAMAEFSLAGAIIGGVAFWSIETALGVAAVLGVATYVGTLLAAFGPRGARVGLFLTLWAVIAIILGSVDTNPLTVSAAFLVGGAIALGITAIRLSLTTEDDADDDDATIGESATSDIAPAGSAWVRMRWASQGAMGEFAIVRTFAVVLSVFVGFWLFPAHPYWGPITVIIIVKPSTSQTASIAVQRTLGTTIGAFLAVVAVQQFPKSDGYAAVGFAVSAFFMVAFMNANYTVFAVFLTSTLMFSLRMVQGDAFDAGVERLSATFAGAVISFLTVAVATRIHDRRPVNRG